MLVATKWQLLSIFSAHRSCTGKPVAGGVLLIEFSYLQRGTITKNKCARRIDFFCSAQKNLRHRFRKNDFSAGEAFYWLLLLLLLLLRPLRGGESLRRRRLSSAKAEELGEAERAIKACGAQLTLRRRSSSSSSSALSTPPPSRPPEARNLTDIG